MIVARLSTVNGSCTIAGYEKWFLVESVDFGFNLDHIQKKDTGKEGNDFVVGRREETTITINKQIDKSSCDLMFQAMKDRFSSKGKTAANGLVADIHFIENIATVDGKDATSGVIAYLRIALETVKVRSWTISGSSDSKPSETVTLWCEQLAMKYQLTKDGVSYSETMERGWDQAVQAQDQDSWRPKNNDYFNSKYFPKWS